MGVSEILASVDREIALLKQVRALLNGKVTTAPEKNAREHKRNVVLAISAAKAPIETASTKKKKRRLSPEGRKRIAEAVRRRWEAQRKAATSK
jgi:hypothetical protein